MTLKTKMRQYEAEVKEMTVYEIDFIHLNM